MNMLNHNTMVVAQYRYSTKIDLSALPTLATTISFKSQKDYNIIVILLVVFVGGVGIIIFFYYTVLFILLLLLFLFIAPIII